MLDMTCPQPADIKSVSYGPHSWISELREELSQYVIMALPLIGVALVLIPVHGDPLYGGILGVVLILLPLPVVVLLRRDARAGVWALIAGLTAITIVAVALTGYGALLCLLALPGLLATYLLGLAAGMATSAALSSLVFVVVHVEPLLAGNDIVVAALATLWGTSGLAWLSIKPMEIAMEWSWAHYEGARDQLEQARSHRMVLHQTLEDLTDANLNLVRLNERVRALQQVAEQARKTKEEFVAKVSHELRTPLNMIIGFSEVILQRPTIYGAAPPAALLADIAIIHRNSLHLSRLVDDILDLSQLEGERMAINRECASVSDVVREAADAIAPLFGSKALKLDVEVPPDLPLLPCDRLRIGQVILNLLSNAARFTEQGGATIRAWADGGEVMISVSDTGPGIEKGNLEKVFEPFQQADGSITRRYGGSGLGLSISRHLVELHGGKIWCDSQVGAGAAFTFSLPLAEIPACEAGARRWFRPHSRYRERDRRSLAPHQVPTARVLVLEQGDTLTRLLDRSGDSLQIVTVGDVQEARRELEATPCSAFLVNDTPFDRALSRLLQFEDLLSGTPGLACSVLGSEETAGKLGVVTYLTKPVSRDSILAALDSMGRDIETVLLADDDPEALQLYARMLFSAERGYQLLRATDGRQVISLLEQTRPDAILLDLVMPGMSGWDILAARDSIPALADTPIVIVSAIDPAGQPIISPAVAATRHGGISAGDLLACIGAMTEILSPVD